ncbi:hypothetical protein KCU79_g86, partial [Aureobasidium melanogenum]
MAPGSKFTSIVVNLPTHHQIHRSTRSKSCWLRRDRLQLPFVFEPARLSKLAQSPTPSLLPELGNTSRGSKRSVETICEEVGSCRDNGCFCVCA